MKKTTGYLFAIICICGLLGCTAATSSETTIAQPEQSKLSEQSEITALTEDELAYFNGDSFFNRDSFDVRNQFLSSLYSRPEEINLYELFYNGADTREQIEGDELADVIKGSGMSCSVEDLPCPCTKISRFEMDEVLMANMGITLAQTDGLGLDGFVYLSEYDSYYHIHGDTNFAMEITFSRGEREGDLIRLFYSDIFYGDGNKVLTLKVTDGGYLFVSNQLDNSETAAD